MSFNDHFFFSLCSTCECSYYSGQTYPLRPGFLFQPGLSPLARRVPSDQKTGHFIVSKLVKLGLAGSHVPQQETVTNCFCYLDNQRQMRGWRGAGAVLVLWEVGGLFQFSQNSKIWRMLRIRQEEGVRRRNFLVQNRAAGSGPPSWGPSEFRNWKH